MDKMMDNPWFLRIISLLFAVLLFISVQNELEGNQINAVGTSSESIQDVPVEVYYDDDNLVVTGAPETLSWLAGSTVRLWAAIGTAHRTANRTSHRQDRALRQM